MITYLVWNKIKQMWRMESLIGFTEECEFAGVFTESYLRNHTGMFDTRTGDYINNVLVSASALAINDFERRMNNMSKSDKNALKKAITKERKRRNMPIEIEVINGVEYCPYCKKKFIPLYSRENDIEVCHSCLKRVIIKGDIFKC